MDTPQVPLVGSGQRTPSRHWERGQTLAVVAIMIVVLVAFLGLVIDGGNVYAQRRQMQNAADAGALAGARALALTKGADTAAVHSAVNDYAVRRNGAMVYTATIDGPHVTVVVTKTVPTYFISVIGIPSLPVGARAKAGVYEVTDLGCGILPLTVPDRTSWPTDDFTIWDTEPNTGEAPGPDDVRAEQHGWLNLNGGSLSDDELKCWASCPITSPCSHPEAYPLPDIAAPMVVNGDPGSRNSTLQVVGDCWTHQIVLIPVYDSTCDHRVTPTPPPPPTPAPTACWVDLGNGQVNYQIVGFIPFYVETVVDRGQPRYISGHVVTDGYIVDPECVKGSRSGFSDVSTVRLEPIAP